MVQSRHITYYLLQQLLVGVGRLERCAACERPVFLAERLVIGGKLRHRSCFRCARCGHLLNPVSCYETETGDFVCEMCPDEGQKTSEIRFDSEKHEVSVIDGSKNVEKTGNGATGNDVTVLAEEIPAKPPDEIKKRFLNDILDGEKTDDSVNVTTTTNNNDSDLVDNSVNRLSERLDKDIDEEVNKELPPKVPEISTTAYCGDIVVEDNVSEDLQNQDLPPLPKSDIEIVVSPADNVDDAMVDDVLTEMTIDEKGGKADGDVSERKEGENGIGDGIGEGDKRAESVLTLEGSIEEFDKSGGGDNVLRSDEDIRNQKEDRGDEIGNGSGDYVANPEEGESIPSEKDNVTESGPKKDESELQEDSTEPNSSAINTELGATIPDQGSLNESQDKSSAQKSDSNQYPTALNPFGDSDDEEEDECPSPVPSCRKVEVNNEGKTVIEAPKHLNPFWSESDEEDEEELTKPVPAPRTLRTPEPIPRNRYGSATSITSQFNKKKRPAPPPPPDPALLRSPSSSQSNVSSPTSSRSPATTRRRKSRAPPPPTSLSIGKEQKDFENKVKQNMTPDKSTYGKWKRKKGAAPGLPVPPQRRLISAPFFGDVHQEAEDLEVQQAELERQGVQVEQNIRLMEEKGDVENCEKTVDEMVLQLFEIVNQKNELFRRQAELMFLRKQQRLEEEHADIEYQIRCLMGRPKNEADPALEAELIQRLIDVVERRNEIVHCLDMNKKRAIEEDQSIQDRLQAYTTNRETADLPLDQVEEEPASSKKGTKNVLKLIKMKKEKRKEREEMEKKMKDEDVDIDESLPPPSSKNTLKLKKKWFKIDK